MLQQLNERYYNTPELPVTATLTEAWETVNPQLGIFVGFNAIMLVINLVIRFTIGILAIPLAAFIQIANLNGLYLSAEKQERLSLSTFFEITQHPRFMNAFIANIVTVLLAGLAIVVFFLPFISVIGFSFISEMANPDAMNDEAIRSFIAEKGILIFLTGLFAFCGTMYVSLVTSFSTAAVFFASDSDQWWDISVKTVRVMGRRFFPILGIYLLYGIIASFVTVFTVGLGLLVLVPVGHALNYVIFRRIIGFEPSGADEDITKHLVL